LGFGLKGADMTEAKRRTVAIVDDNHAVLDSLQFLLEVVGHTVEIFASGAEFLQANVNHFACLISDQHMSNMTGLELAAKLRADGADISILLITGSPSPTITDRAAKLGVQVLDKPPSEEALIDFINVARS
jgi:two-component system, LuxR family, response regulator FixJ